MAEAASWADALITAERDAVPIPEAEWTPPPSLDVAYEIQSLVAEGLGRRRCGWKAGATSAAVQHRRRLTGPVFGRLFEGRVFETGAALPRSLFIQPGIEAEFAFLIGKPLPARSEPYSEIEVRNAVDAVAPAIEIADGRLAHWRGCDGCSSAADNVGHGAAVLGARHPATAIDGLAEIATALEMDGRTAAPGNGAAVLGHPIHALHWLVEDLRQRGLALQPGEWVLSGTTNGLTPCDGTRRVAAKFERFGEVTLAFTE